MDFPDFLPKLHDFSRSLKSSVFFQFSGDPQEPCQSNGEQRDVIKQVVTADTVSYRQRPPRARSTA